MNSSSSIIMNNNSNASTVASKITKPAHKLKARVEKVLLEKKIASTSISYKREDLLALRNSAATKKMAAPMNIPAEIAALHL